MSSFTFNCVHCSKSIKAEDEYRGAAAECPHCGKPVTVPPAAFVPAPSARSETPCPFCGENVLATAKKCKHCGEFLDDSARPQSHAPVQNDEPEADAVDTRPASTSTAKNRDPLPDYPPDDETDTPEKRNFI